MLDYLRIVLSAHLPKRDERGASAVEYGLLIAAVAAMVALIVFAFGDNIAAIFQETCDTIGTESDVEGTDGCPAA